MTLQAQFWVHEQGQPPREQTVELTDADDVRAFIKTLAGEQVSDALLTHTWGPVSRR